MSKKKKIVLLAVSAVAIIAVIAGILFAVNQNNQPRNQFQNSNTVEQVFDLTTVNGNEPSSVMVAPATAEWWDTMLQYNYARLLLEDLEWDDISTDVEYIAYTTSPGNFQAEDGSIGYPTTFLIYADEATATEQVGTLRASYAAEAVGNIIMLMPPGAFVDLDYAYSQFEEIAPEGDVSDLNLNGEAWWWFNFQAFETLYTAGYDGADVQVYRDLVSMFGVNENTTWFGTSDDGLAWDGRFYDYDPSAIAPLDNIYEYLMNTQAYLMNDGTLHYASDGPMDYNEQSGIMYPRQSVVALYMTVQTHEASFGRLTSLEEGEQNPDEENTAPPLLTDEDDELLRLTMEPNPWLGFMMGETVAKSPTWFNLAELSLNEDGSSTLTLTPRPLDAETGDVVVDAQGTGTTPTDEPAAP